MPPAGKTAYAVAWSSTVTSEVPSGMVLSVRIGVSMPMSLAVWAIRSVPSLSLARRTGMVLIDLAMAVRMVMRPA
ncbi:hypothetical protein D3C71_1992280 [compost metagenome]